MLTSRQSTPQRSVTPASTAQEQFLLRAAQAARLAGHLFPEYAACEAALESAWGESRLAREGNNLFGQKQAHPPLPGTGTLSIETREFLHGQWVTVPAHWARFADWADCFRARMAVLEALRHAYPQYAAALAAASGPEFVEQVSVHWSTDPDRARKVLAVHAAHARCFAPTLQA
jgi:flagellum-specific peptidoglycan hydrolase FlgJ